VKKLTLIVSRLKNLAEGKLNELDLSSFNSLFSTLLSLVEELLVAIFGRELVVFDFTLASSSRSLAVLVRLDSSSKVIKLSFDWVLAIELLFSCLHELHSLKYQTILFDWVFLDVSNCSVSWFSIWGM
jgi:hypothetical protein